MKHPWDTHWMIGQVIWEAEEATALPRRFGAESERPAAVPPSLAVTGQLGNVMKETWGPRSLVRHWWVESMGRMSGKEWFQGWCMLMFFLLVFGLEDFSFFHILGIIIPIGSYFSEGLKPPSSLWLEHLESDLESLLSSIVRVSCSWIHTSTLGTTEWKLPRSPLRLPCWWHVVSCKHGSKVDSLRQWGGAWQGKTSRIPSGKLT